VCPCEVPIEGDNVFYLNARDGQDWISGGFRGNYNLSYSLQADGTNSSGVNPSGENWGGCGFNGAGADSADFCLGGGGGDEVHTSFFDVGFGLCQVNAQTYALFCSISARCNLRRVFPEYVYCDPIEFYSPPRNPDMTSCGALTIILPSGRTLTVNIFGYMPYDPTASATLTLSLV
jgi:hypothetical protein